MPRWTKGTLGGERPRHLSSSGGAYGPQLHHQRAEHNPMQDALGRFAVGEAFALPEHEILLGEALATLGFVRVVAFVPSRKAANSLKMASRTSQVLERRTPVDPWA